MGGGFIVPVLEVADLLLRLYMWVIVAAAAMGWLISFRVLGDSVPVAVMGGFLRYVTEPALRRIRRFLPHLGGLDVSPVIALIAIWLARMELANLIFYVYRL